MNINKEYLIYNSNFRINQHNFKIKGVCLNYIDNSAQFWINYDKLIFPLKIRKWNLNDFIYPIYMNGSKKISKYLRDKKLSQYFKNKIYVLVDNLNRVILILGMRLDHRFRVVYTTKKILNIWMDF